MKKEKLIAFNFNAIIVLAIILISILSSRVEGQSQVIQDSLRSIKNESVLNAYKILLDEESDYEYGWICQSIVPIIPKGRKALLILIRQGRFDLIKTLLDASKVETQLYALDALIYEKIKSKKFLGSELSSKLQTLKESNMNVATCPDFIGNYWNNSYDSKTIIISMTHDERVENLDYLLSEPFVRKPIKIEPINGNW